MEAASTAGATVATGATTTAATKLKLQGYWLKPKTRGRPRHLYAYEPATGFVCDYAKSDGARGWHKRGRGTGGEECRACKAWVAEHKAT